MGQTNLDKSDLNLNLGAIPSFYLYRDGFLCDTLVSSSHVKLESFIETNYVRDPITNNDETNYELNALKEAEKLKVFKCSLCSQFGHKTTECKLQPENTNKNIKINEKKNSDPKKQITIVVNEQKKPVERLAIASAQHLDLKLSRSFSNFNNNNNNNNNNIKNSNSTNNLKNNGTISTIDLQKNKAKPASFKELKEIKEAKEVKESKEIKEQNQIKDPKDLKLSDDSSKDLLDKISKLEALAKKQKEEIAMLKQKLEEITNENIILKRNKSSYY